MRGKLLRGVCSARDVLASSLEKIFVIATPVDKKRTANGAKKGFRIAGGISGVIWPIFFA